MNPKILRGLDMNLMSPRGLDLNSSHGIDQLKDPD